MNPLRKFGFLFITLLISFFLFELAIRAIYQVPFLLPAKPVQRYLDPWCGARQVPGQRTINIHMDGVTLFETDRFGFRGPDRPLPPNSRKVLVLGDSFIEGAQVPWKNHLAYRLEQKFSGSGWESFVMAQGVGGWDLENQYQFLRHPGVAQSVFPPSDLVLSVFLGNDIIDLGDTETTAAPQTILHKDSLQWLNIPLSPRKHNHSFYNPFVLFRIIEFRWPFLKSRWFGPKPVLHARQNPPSPSKPDPYPELRNLMKIYLPDTPREIDGKWEIFSRLLEKVQEFCLKNNIRLTVMIIPERREVSDTVWTLTLKVLDADKELYSRHLPRTRMLALCKKQGIPVIDLYPVFQPHPDAFLPGDGHFSPHGHQLVADHLYLYLLKNG